MLTLHIGCAPALLNVSISGDSLIHCLKYSDTKILLVDQDDKYNGRVDKERHRIENDLHMNIIILSEHLKQKIAARELSKIDNSYRENVRGDSPAAILYTRYALTTISSRQHLLSFCILLDLSIHARI